MVSTAAKKKYSLATTIYVLQCTSVVLGTKALSHTKHLPVAPPPTLRRVHRNVEIGGHLHAIHLYSRLLS